MTFGYTMDTFDLEFSLGYWSEEMDYTEPEARYDWNEKYSKYSFGLAGLYHLKRNDTFGIDGGLRFVLHNEKWEYEESDTRYEDTMELSGWSVGPVLRGRWFFADGSMAIGPEVFLKYTSRTWSQEWDSGDDELDLTTMGVEYAVRWDFMF